MIATALSAFIGTVLMAAFTNYPFVLYILAVVFVLKYALM